MKTKTTPIIRKITRSLATLLAIAVAPGAYAANGTWTNAPADGSWANVLNWNGGIVPGAINNTGNNGTDSASVAFFTNAITTFGGSANPVTPDDATVVNGKARMMGRVVFDGPNCGAYVFSSPSPYAAQTATTPETGVMSLCVPAPVNQNATNGSYITAGVTNPQTFLVPVQIRLPSSTTGWYGFTNDATSLNATYYFQRLFLYPGGTGRGVTFIFAGSNTGTNTVALLEQSVNQTGAPTGILKTGPGRWILSGANTFNGGSAITINEGTLEVLNPAAFGAATTATVTNTGTLLVDGVTLNQGFISLRTGGTIRANGMTTINGVAVGNHVGTTATLATTSASDVFTVGSGLVLSSVVAGGAVDTVLHLSGPGTIQLNTANTYLGTWSFDSGTNQIINPGGLNSAIKAHIAAGAVLDTSLLGSYALTAADLSGNGAGTVVGSTASTIDAGPGGTFDIGTKSVSLTFTPTSFSGDMAHPALYISQGTLSVSGNAYNVNNASGTPLGAGTYRLVQQASGNITVAGTGIAIVGGAGLVAGHVPEIVISGGNIDLLVVPYTAKNLTWQGGNPDSTWDRLTTFNWSNGAATNFNFYDNVTFNAAGAGFPNITISETMIPASTTVDATTDYSFTGGEIAGTGSLTKKNTGVLMLNQANTYRGGTVVSNGTLRVGIENAISGAGAGDVAVYSPATIDLNGFNNTINGLNGNGTVDISSGGASTLTVGDHNNSGSFSGVIRNTSGSLGLTKIGSGTQTLTASNTYTGTTTVNAGTLRVENFNALGSGASAVVVNGGALNVTTNVIISSLSGTGGTVANATTTLTNTITLLGGGSYSGVIANGSAGRIKLFVKSGTNQLNGVSTFTEGTTVASGATLAIGVINGTAGGVPGTGAIIASNGASITLSTSLSTSSQVPNAISNIVAGGTVFLSSIGQANSFNGQFFGSATSTNIYSGTMTIGGATSFSNFLGTAVISNGASIRTFNANAGGDNTTFLVEGGLFSRDANTIRLGALIGSEGGIYNPSVTVPATFLIGAKGLSTTFSGIIQGSNNIVKVGAGSLTLDGRSYYTNIVTLPDPFEPTNIVSFTLFSNRVTHVNNTTVSNGTLRIIAPNNLTNSASITLAGTAAVLDASNIGYATNQTVVDFGAVEQATNTVVVTNATVQILAGQSLNGIGGILGNVSAEPGSTISAGLPVGTLTVSGNLSINGAVNMSLNRTNLTQNSSRLVAGSFAGGGATLTVTNVGPTLVSGSTYQLFSGPVSMFTTVNLPATDATGLIPYTWQNDVADNGSITLVSGLSATPVNFTTTQTGTNTLVLGWPLDHLGWTLQVQTNALNVGLRTNWFAVAGSTTNNQVVVPVVRTNATVFYRLILPLP